MSFQSITSDTEIACMKTRLRAMEHKRDNIAIDIAIDQNLPNVWSLEMIDWEQVDPITADTFNKIISDIGVLSDKIREAEAINDGSYEFYCAEKKVYSFLNSLTLEEASTYLKSLRLTTHGLIGEVEKNPNFISETYKGVKV